MANRRMFSKVVTNSDLFLDMPGSTQALYFHLGMNADDDGFVQAKTIMRQVGSNPDDLKLLLAKSFLIAFEDGVIVVRDWKVNNEIRQDRYKETFYLEHKARLGENSNRQYSLVVPKNNRLDTQYRIGKVRLGKSSPIRKEEDQLRKQEREALEGINVNDIPL